MDSDQAPDGLTDYDEAYQKSQIQVESGFRGGPRANMGELFLLQHL